MQNKYVAIQSISDLHMLYQLPKPSHPLVSFFDLKKVNWKNWNNVEQITFYQMGFYSIYCKKFNSNSLRYGKSYYDFKEGSLMFMAPNQVISPSPDLQKEGWGLVFHPDLLNNSSLGNKINSYSFFHYDTNEALHISEDEKLILKDCVEKIRKEYSQNIDKHTQTLIQTNIELLLNYCDRFYDRQFLTRAKVSNDIVQKFERLLKDYFNNETIIEIGLPDVKYFALALNLSPSYLSDLLKRFTGKSTQEHIHLQLTDKAKTLLWSSGKSVSEIAYELGFDHPSHFTKIFKAKTGKSPTEYRHLN